MLFISVDDFFKKTAALRPITREQERAYAVQMKNGDADARQAIITGYLPYVAASVRHLEPGMQTFTVVMACCAALEKAVDSFNFLQDSERFSHRLSWWMRQTITRCIAQR